MNKLDLLLLILAAFGAGIIVTLCLFWFHHFPQIGTGAYIHN